MATLSDKKEDYKAYTDIKKAIEDNKDLIDLVELSDEEELDTLEEIDKNLKTIKKNLASLKLKTQLNGEYDRNNAYLSINAGAGGLEATDWADMLFRMYTRYC